MVLSACMASDTSSLRRGLEPGGALALHGQGGKDVSHGAAKQDGV